MTLPVSGCRQVPFLGATAASTTLSSPDPATLQQALQISLTVKLPLSTQGIPSSTSLAGPDTVLFRTLTSDGQNNPVYTTVAMPTIDLGSGLATAFVPSGYAIDIYHVAADGHLVSEQIVPPVLPNISAAVAANIDTPQIMLPPSGELSTLSARIVVAMAGTTTAANSANSNAGSGSSGSVAPVLPNANDPSSLAFDFGAAARMGMALRNALIPASGGGALTPTTDWNAVNAAASSIATTVINFEAQQGPGLGRQEDLFLALATGNNVLAGMSPTGVLTAPAAGNAVPVAPTYTSLVLTATAAQVAATTPVFRAALQTEVASLVAQLPGPLQLPTAKAAAVQAALTLATANLTSSSSGGGTVANLSASSAEWLQALFNRQLTALTDPNALLQLAQSGFTQQDPTSQLLAKFGAVNPGGGSAQAVAAIATSFSQLSDSDQTAASADWLALLGLDDTRADLIQAVKAAGKSGVPLYTAPTDSSVESAAAFSSAGL